MNPPAARNALQRWYFTKAQPYYDRMEPGLRAEAMRIDQHLYGEAGVGVLIGLVCATLGSTLGLAGAGFPWVAALLCSLIVWFGMLFGLLAAWLRPERYTLGRVLRNVVWVVLGAYAGALLGFLTGSTVLHGRYDTDSLTAALQRAASQAVPLLGVGVLAIVVLSVSMWAVAQQRRVLMQRELAQLRLEQQRDALARQVAEARLKLLQAQIQPHFLFNTLASLQHWVDGGDARAAPLLRNLTAFLRGATELMARDEVPLADELQLARHYLAIMQSRQGPRLSFDVQASEAALAQPLPPGLLLTLVENAVEHGVEAALHDVAVHIAAGADTHGWWLSVADTGPGLAPGWQTGVGLANARERLHHRHGPNAKLDLRDAGPGTVAELRISGPQTSPHTAPP